MNRIQSNPAKEGPAYGTINSGLITLAAIVVFACVWCLVGCATNIKNQSEVGFRWGTEVTFFSRAAQTAPEAATATLKFPPLEEYFLRERNKATPASGVTESDHLTTTTMTTIGKTESVKP